MSDDDFPTVHLDPPEESITRNLIVLLLDASGSMLDEDRTADGTGLGKSKIDTLREALDRFLLVEMHEQSKLQTNGELAIVTFGGAGVGALDLGVPVLPGSPFHFVRTVTAAPTLLVGGGTPMGAGIRHALRIIEDRKVSLADSGISHESRPNVFLLTDGKANDPRESLAEAISALHAEEKAKGVLLWALGTTDADRRQMQAIANKDNYWDLPGNSLTSFLKFVSASMRHVGGRRGDENAQDIYAETRAKITYDEKVNSLFGRTETR